MLGRISNSVVLLKGKTIYSETDLLTIYKTTKIDKKFALDKVIETLAQVDEPTRNKILFAMVHFQWLAKASRLNSKSIKLEQNEILKNIFTWLSDIPYSRKEVNLIMQSIFRLIYDYKNYKEISLTKLSCIVLYLFNLSMLTDISTHKNPILREKVQEFALFHCCPLLDKYLEKKTYPNLELFALKTTGHKLLYLFNPEGNLEQIACYKREKTSTRELRILGEGNYGIITKPNNEYKPFYNKKLKSEEIFIGQGQQEIRFLNKLWFAVKRNGLTLFYPPLSKGNKSYLLMPAGKKLNIDSNGLQDKLNPGAIRLLFEQFAVFHQLGYYHGDIKPDNLLYQDGYLKVIDIHFFPLELPYGTSSYWPAKLMQLDLELQFNINEVNEQHLKKAMQISYQQYNRVQLDNFALLLSMIAIFDPASFKWRINQIKYYGLSFIGGKDYISKLVQALIKFIPKHSLQNVQEFIINMELGIANISINLAKLWQVPREV